MSNVAAHTHRLGDHIIRYDKENGKCVVKKLMFNQPMSNEFRECSIECLNDVRHYIVDTIESTEYFKQLNNKGEAVV